MIIVGTAHFVRPGPFVRIVPDWLPAPLLMVYVSGFFEILGGVGLLVPRTRRLAAWGLIALFIAVLPANVHMAIHRIPVFGITNPDPTLLWLRVPLQALWIWWAWAYTRP